MTGDCAGASGQPAPTASTPCRAGVQGGSSAGVTDQTYLEFGAVESIALCESAASAAPAHYGRCQSITWHSPACEGCGAKWMKHCYCALSGVWLHDMPGMADHVSQKGVESAKCVWHSDEGWEFVWLFLGAASLYLVGGVVWQRTKHPGARGMKLLPHRQQWIALYGLVLDGVRFVSGKWDVTHCMEQCIRDAGD